MSWSFVAVEVDSSDGSLIRHIYISESLNELMDLVGRLFNPVINCNVNIPTFEYHPYKEDQLQVLYDYVSITHSYQDEPQDTYR